MPRIPRPRLWIAVAIIAGSGIARLPLETRFAAELRHLGFRAAELDLSVGDKLSQNLAVAVVGGFRSLTASILSLQAHSAWEFTRWDDIKAYYDIITKLQPRVEHYWWEANRYLAYDAASNNFYDESIPNSVRRTEFEKYVTIGRTFLEEGVKNIPGSHLLAADLAQIYRSRTIPPDHCSAARWYAVAAAIDGAPPYYRRFHAIELSLCPGSEQQAYQALRALYLESERHHMPTLLIRLHEIENQLGVPAADRLVPEKPRSSRG